MKVKILREFLKRLRQRRQPVKSLFGSMGAKAEALSFSIAKYDGEKKPGDGKEPFEYVKGGKGQPTVRTAPDGTVLEVLKEAEEGGEE
jgi:hypothetical protein